ncbi:hypothetical protein GY45DRAFT_364696 [Cubamyces sp. BRFM 1775]|nr:hypothetical protein GY45DRAFT_364696 [Cubamyces sp. BRFM 1775]
MPLPSRQNKHGDENTSVDEVTDCDEASSFRPLTPPETPRSPVRHNHISYTCSPGESSGQGEQSSPVYSNLQPDTHVALNQLLTSSGATLNNLERSLSIVADQTLALTTIATMRGTAKKIELLEAEVRSHGEAQNVAIENAKIDVQQAVEEHIAQTLRPRVAQMVADAVEQVIGNCVQTTLESLVQERMKDEINRYRMRILEVSTMLADAETRRRKEQRQSEAPSTFVRGIEATPVSTAATAPTTAHTPAAAPTCATILVPDVRDAPETRPAPDTTHAPSASPAPEITPPPNTTRSTPVTRETTPTPEPTPAPAYTSSPRRPPPARGSQPACVDATHPAMPPSHWNLQVSMGAVVLLAWIAVCASLGDGADAGVRMAFS